LESYGIAPEDSNLDRHGMWRQLVSMAIFQKLRGTEMKSVMQHTTQSKQSKRRGFTLVELVVVVLVLGIIAAVASPKMFDTTSDARDSSTKTTLSVMRDAIELYKAEVGAYPGDLGTAADFKADVAPYINGPFPANTLTGAAQDASVTVETDGGALLADLDSLTDWLYDKTTGEFIINEAGYATF
jgi:general secretion pathway protein G